MSLIEIGEGNNTDSSRFAPAKSLNEIAGESKENLKSYKCIPLANFWDLSEEKDNLAQTYRL